METVRIRMIRDCFNWEKDLPKGWEGEVRIDGVNFYFDMPNGETACIYKKECEVIEEESHQVGGNHYSHWAIEPIKFIQENKLPFCEGNVIKYIMRWERKDGVKDLMKAKQYIDFLIEKATSEVLDNRTRQS